MSKYAEGTEVPVDRSRAEIERMLERYGADQFVYGWEKDVAVIGFRYAGRVIRFKLPLPNLQSPEVSRTPTGRTRSKGQQADALGQEVRRRWRALTLAIKAKLEVCTSGIATFEDEFLAYTILPDGQTVSQWAQPQLRSAYESGRMPVGLLPAGTP